MSRRKRKQRIVEGVSLSGIADKGKAVGRNEEGEVFFVEGGVPGDVVDVLVLKKRKGVAQGRVKNFQKTSPERVEPFCQHFDICGGCKWQDLSYEGQLKYKETQVKDALRRIGKVDVNLFQPILGAPETQYYRNKLEFTYCNKRWLTEAEIGTDVSNVEDVLGFHKAGAFDKMIDIKHCYLQGGISNDLRLAAKAIGIEQGLPFYNPRTNLGFLRNIIIRTTELGEIMVIVVVNGGDIEKISNYLDEIKSQFPQITSLNYCVNTKVNDFILDLDIVCYSGQSFITENLGDINFQIGPKSFFQTNTKQAVRLFDVVKEFAQLNGSENVYDLYTGIGSIALYVAEDCKQVVGIEEVAAAIDDAKLNQERNNIDNAVFYAGDVKDILTDEFSEKHGKPDMVITDPPRAGMHPKVVQTLLALAAPKIVYVSCNPATQARDLLLLKAKYKVTKVRPVDMFPHTHHVENVALLELLPETEWQIEAN
ncbi:MAG: 23S rRNA (uracil(1939)-C(5))-methyltransferase RlmD [Saprospiraceae bacterium]